MQKTIECDPKTKQEYRLLLALLYQHWLYCKLPITVYPTCYVKGALRLDGVIGGKRIGSIVR